MTVVGIAGLKTSLPRGKRLLGLDVGTKTIGLAIADPRQSIATPLDTIRRKRFTNDMAALARIVAERDIGGLVVGLPVSMDGSEGPRCQSVRQFAANVLEKLDIAIAFWDERLSTAAVTRMMIDEADLSRRRRGEVVDKLAAAYILQGALDYTGS